VGDRQQAERFDFALSDFAANVTRDAREWTIPIQILVAQQIKTS
jgi:hypothetical protein